MSGLFFPFTVGFLGSLHCLSMCGPLVLAYSLQARDPKEITAGPTRHPLPAGLLHHLAFHTGRLFTYGLLGALAAGLFRLASFQQLFTGLRGGMSMAGGFIMVLLGLAFLRILPTPAFLGSGRLIPVCIRQRLLPALFQAPQPGAKALLGLLAGFMPCCLSWAMIAKAATEQEIVTGFLTMIAFGLGTMPALLAVGLFTSILSLKLRLLGERLAACAVIFMGIFLMTSGAGVFV
jgi:sulfite exporter TauE/SafE